MNKSYEEWLQYYKNATKEQVIEDMMLDIAELKSKNKKLDNIKFYIEQSNIKDMLWGKEILKIIGGNDDSTRNV